MQKKKPAQKEEETSLEDLQRLMHGDPSKGEEFYSRLFAGEVFLLGETAGRLEGQHMLSEDTTVHVQHWMTQDGQPFIPVFTSMDALELAVQKESNFLSMNGREAIGMLAGTTLVINPGNPYAFQVTPPEMEAILNYFSAKEITVEDNTQVLLGAPAKDPAEMKEALRAVFRKDGRVQSAYFAQMVNPATEEISFLVGIVFRPGQDNTVIFDKAGAAAKGLMPEGVFLDFLVIKEDGEKGLPEYLLKSGERFYRASTDA
jgi:hypothetical protein